MLGHHPLIILFVEVSIAANRSLPLCCPFSILMCVLIFYYLFSLALVATLSLITSSCCSFRLMGIFAAHGLVPRNYLWCTGPTPCTAEDLPSSSFSLFSFCHFKLVLATRIARVAQYLYRAHLNYSFCRASGAAQSYCCA